MLKKLFKLLFGPKVIKNYVSDIDQFLQDFDKKNTHKSKSQRDEINRHKIIKQKRDHVTKSTGNNNLWNEF